MAIQLFEHEEAPSEGAPSAFAFTIHYDALTDTPQRVLGAAADLSAAFQALDDAIVTAIDPHITTRLAILGFESGSLKTILASILRSVDDEALKDLDIKGIIGAYLVRGKYLVLRWLESDDRQRSLAQLEDEIRVAAEATEIKRMPLYGRPSRRALISGLRRTQAAKESLTDEDWITFQGAPGEVILQPTRRLDLSNIVDIGQTTRRTFQISRAPLPVKKPDYLGKSQWQLRMGDRTIRATIADRSWLANFQARQVPLQPGDAIICDAELRMEFDPTGTPVNEHVTVTKVYDVQFMPSPPPLLLP